MLGSIAMLLLGVLAIASGAAIPTAGALLTGKTALLNSIPLSSLGGRIDLSLHFSPANVSFRT